MFTQPGSRPTEFKVALHLCFRITVVELALGMAVFAQPSQVVGQPEPPLPVPPSIQPQVPQPPSKPPVPTLPPTVVTSVPVPQSGPIPALPKFDEKAPRKSFLPSTPEFRLPGARFVDRLEDVPEIKFHADFPKDKVGAKALSDNLLQLAKIRFLNEKEIDGFLKTLLKEREDLQGLPFRMGDSCRMKLAKTKYFKQAVADVSSRFGSSIQPLSKQQSEQAWRTFRIFCANDGQPSTTTTARECDAIIAARIAALRQVLGPQTAHVRLGLANYLATIPHKDATRVLAELVLFSPEPEVRKAAIVGLRVRREQDYTDLLLTGFRHPWAPTAKHAAEAIVTLKRDDLLDKLVDVLDEPDPRMPVMRDSGKKSVIVVRELVRVNHHRNCMLCHSPSDGKNIEESIVAEMPTHGESFPSGRNGYGSGNRGNTIRADVTYLRQQFSRTMEVKDASPWPTLQRFDFLVRTREISEKDAKAWEEIKKEEQRPGYVSEYHRAALFALRELTGLDTAPTAAAWRKLLKGDQSK